MSGWEFFWLGVVAIITDISIYTSLTDASIAPVLWASVGQSTIALGGIGLHLVLKELRAIRATLETPRPISD